ncbi:hypothetical protein EVAR_33400_1 [Eumeta japonica]|uniref:Uncharacterized protein n=1 Tax=Eumeta variegata TaxID=151549 RepID=A0A4C1W1M7_EUMVA|nr:hypothetical protein EVAR_33400_1 [Eumeta japonica]
MGRFGRLRRSSTLSRNTDATSSPIVFRTVDESSGHLFGIWNGAVGERRAPRRPAAAMNKNQMRLSHRRLPRGHKLEARRRGSALRRSLNTN